MILKFVVFLAVVAVLVMYVTGKRDDFTERITTGDESEEVTRGEESVPAVAVEEFEAFGSAADSGTGDLFPEYRIARDRARDRQINLLREMTENPNASEETRSNAGRQLLFLTRQMGQEVAAENLIQAKGFEDVVVFLAENSAVVVVKAKEISRTEAAQIGDIISRITGLSLEAINIIAHP